MGLPSQSVKAFVDDSYQLVSASSPSVPLQGNDQSKGIQFLNELMSSYSGTGLMTTIAKEVSTVLAIGQQFVTFADPAYTPTADIPLGRLSNLQNAWLLLDGVTYPMYDESRNTFFASYKYDPLKGLPRFRLTIGVTAVSESDDTISSSFSMPSFVSIDTLISTVSKVEFKISSISFFNRVLRS